MLVIKRIHARYHLRVDPDTDKAVVERVHGFHADKCPVARSLRGAIDISTELSVVST